MAGSIRVVVAVAGAGSSLPQNPPHALDGSYNRDQAFKSTAYPTQRGHRRLLALPCDMPSKLPLDVLRRGSVVTKVIFHIICLSNTPLLPCDQRINNSYPLSSVCACDIQVFFWPVCSSGPRVMAVRGAGPASLWRASSRCAYCVSAGSKREVHTLMKQASHIPRLCICNGISFMCFSRSSAASFVLELESCQGRTLL